MAFNKERRTMGFKLETTPYTRESSLTSSDYNLRVSKIEYDPDIMMTARKLSRGDLSLDQAVFGKRSIKIKFSAELYPSPDSYTTPPAWGKVLKACGFAETEDAGNGVTYQVSSQKTNIPATIEIPELDEGTSPSQIVVEAYGAMGDMTINVDGVGKPVSMDFEFTGVLNGFSDRSYSNRIAPAITDIEPTPAVLCQEITYDSVSQILNTVKISTGNKVELYTSPASCTGFLGAHIVSREPSIEFDPDVQPLSTENTFTDIQTADGAAAYSQKIGTKIEITAPKAQHQQAYKTAEREGHVTQNVKLRLCRNTGDDELVIRTGEVAWI